MRLAKIMVMGALASLLAIGIAPLAMATTPPDATITFSPTSCAPPSCIGFGVTFLVAQNDQCPSGGFVTGAVTESGPLGSTTFSVYNPSDTSEPLPCGTSLGQLLGVHPLYPATACDLSFAGTYTFEFSGTTYGPTGGPVGIFDVKATYFVPPCTSVPQFPLGMAALFALAIPMFLALRKWGPAFKAHSV